MKNNAAADKVRDEGNVLFQQGKFFKALISYNKSLCYAMPQSTQLGLAYANRSAVYLEVKQFDKCLDNIRLARDNKYSNEAKLKKREMKCKEEMKKQKPESTKNDPWTYFKLSYPANKKIPFIVDCLELHTNEQFGRHIITNRNLRAGDVIAIEKPIFHSLAMSSSYSNCTFCFKSNMLNLIPCNFENDETACTSAMYCDQTCLTKARDRFHGAYCQTINLMLDQMDEKVVDTAASMWKGLVESLFIVKHPLLLKGLMNSNEQNTIFDYNLSNQVDDPNADFKLLSIFNNLSKDTNQRIESQRRDLSTFFVELSKFGHDPEMVSLLVEYSTRLAMIKRGNSTGFAVQGEKAGGAVVLPFGTLYSHACDTNIRLMLIDNKFVHITLRPIKKGEQLFFNYGFHFAKFHPDRAQRQEAIRVTCNFKCSCLVCVNNYSMYSAPLHKMPPPSNSPDTIEGMMIELKKHFKYIEKNIKNYPSKDLVLSLLCCENVLNDVECKAMWPFERV